MANSTHDEQQPPRRAVHRSEQRRAWTIVISVVGVLVVGALALGGVLLTLRADDATPVVGGDAVDSSAAAAGDSSAADPAAADPPAADVDAPAPCPEPPGAVPTPVTEPYAQRPDADLDGAQRVGVTIETSCGEISLELDADAAPETVGTFVALAEDGYYDGVPFHRVIDDFMIQGGDPTGTGTGCVDAGCDVRLPGYTVPDELALAESLVADDGVYPRGTIAMANTGRPDTGGSQFFIVQADPGYPLPPTYAAFGWVTDGLDVVDRIALGPVEGDQAVDPVVILDVEVRS